MKENPFENSILSQRDKIIKQYGMSTIKVSDISLETLEIFKNLGLNKSILSHKDEILKQFALYGQPPKTALATMQMLKEGFLELDNSISSQRNKLLEQYPVSRQLLLNSELAISKISKGLGLNKSILNQKDEILKQFTPYTQSAKIALASTQMLRERDSILKQCGISTARILDINLETSKIFKNLGLDNSIKSKK